MTDFGRIVVLEKKSGTDGGYITKIIPNTKTQKE